MDYVACERYETRVSDGKDGSAIRMLIDRIQPQEIKFVHGENIK